MKFGIDIGHNCPPDTGAVGIYNGFLSAGALWGLLAMNPKIPAIKPAVFILVCAFIAGVYGSISLGRPTAFVVQSLPAIIALPLIWLDNRNKSGKSSQQNQPA
jgi:putative membrane protein